MKYVIAVCIVLAAASLTACKTTTPPAVEHIAKTKTGIVEAKKSNQEAQQLAGETYREIGGVRVKLDRVDSKSDLVRQWEDYQRRKALKNKKQ